MTFEQELELLEAMADAGQAIVEQRCKEIDKEYRTDTAWNIPTDKFSQLTRLRSIRGKFEDIIERIEEMNNDQ